MNFFQGNDHKKTQAGHISNLQEKQHMQGQQPYLHISVTRPKISWSNKEYHPRHKNMHDQMVNLLFSFSEE